MTTILKATADPNLFARWFKDRNTWAAWFVFLAALFALPMTPDQLDVYRRCTGRTTPPAVPAREGWLVVGRRGGKSFILALVAVYIATFRDYRSYLAPGERGTIMLIARDRRQARTILRYIGALLRVPLLAQMIERETAEGFDLDNNVTIEVHVASFKSTRGYTLVAALCDELAFWPTDDAAEPDVEILAALRPGMATIPGATLLCASSPYARKGALWTAHRKHFAQDGDPVLVWQADTRLMNPSIPRTVIDEAFERDPVSARAEYGAQFRSDIESFVSREIVETCVSRGVFERPPRPNLRYAAFVDPSGGSADSFTLAVSHKDADTLILDAVREVVPPFSPEGVVGEFAELLSSYRVTKVIGDRYAGEWPREQFRKTGFAYEVSAKPKSELYRDLLPLINSRRVELLDLSKLMTQLVGLERRTARGGRDSIDHAPGGHDDIANAVAGALTTVAVPQARLRITVGVCPALGGIPCELDPVTCKPIEPERHNPLSPGPHQGCIPGKGLDPGLSLFNAHHGFNNFPIRRSR